MNQHDESMCRASSNGWVKIGTTDRAGRRSLWMRVEMSGSRCEAFELCSGREGDDAFVRVTRDTTVTVEIVGGSAFDFVYVAAPVDVALIRRIALG